jgi:hypothetical protein
MFWTLLNWYVISKLTSSSYLELYTGMSMLSKAVNKNFRLFNMCGSNFGWKDYA